MNTTSLVLSLALALSALTGCSGNLMTFRYTVVDQPSTPRYLATHCDNYGNCRQIYTDPSK